MANQNNENGASRTLNLNLPFETFNVNEGIDPNATRVSRLPSLDDQVIFSAQDYATRWESILQIIVPAASSGIIGGIMLALGRALGETMAIVMLIGNSNRVSWSLTDPATTISALIANQFAEAQGLQVSALMYAAFVLACITLIVNILAQIVVKQLQKI